MTIVFEKSICPKATAVSNNDLDNLNRIFVLITDLFLFGLLLLLISMLLQSGYQPLPDITLPQPSHLLLALGTPSWTPNNALRPARRPAPQPSLCGKRYPTSPSDSFPLFQEQKLDLSTGFFGGDRLAGFGPSFRVVVLRVRFGKVGCPTPGPETVRNDIEGSNYQ
jgi:hypothetical protein